MLAVALVVSACGDDLGVSTDTTTASADTTVVTTTSVSPATSSSAVPPAPVSSVDITDGPTTSSSVPMTTVEATTTTLLTMSTCRAVGYVAQLTWDTSSINARGAFQDDLAIEAMWDLLLAATPQRSIGTTRAELGTGFSNGPGCGPTGASTKAVNALGTLLSDLMNAMTSGGVQLFGDQLLIRGRWAVLDDQRAAVERRAAEIAARTGVTIGFPVS
jgi:hypothetical protein